MDCSKTEVFLAELNRMCASVFEHRASGQCEDCDLYRKVGGCTRDVVFGRTQTAVEIVQQWSDSHPEPKPKTYADVFLEKFPKASKSYLTQKDYESGIAFPTAKRCHIYGIGIGGCMKEECTNKMQARCWNEPYEESEDER